MYEEVRLIKAARLLNTPINDIEDVPTHWIEWAFVTQNADNLVEKQLFDEATKKGGNSDLVYEDD